jgi:hypothetical protein
MELVLGTVLIVAPLLAFLVALPRGGQAKAFLRNDHVQGYYTITMIGTLTFGLVYVVVGLMAFRG